jgi:hypothetical protein
MFKNKVEVIPPKKDLTLRDIKDEISDVSESVVELTDIVDKLKKIIELQSETIKSLETVVSAFRIELSARDSFVQSRITFEGDLIHKLLETLNNPKPVAVSVTMPEVKSATTTSGAANGNGGYSRPAYKYTEPKHIAGPKGKLP